MNLNIKIKFYDFQKRIIEYGLDYSKKYLVVVASRQIGKSFSLRALSLKYLSSGDSFVGYITLTTKLGRQFYDEFLRNLPKDIVDKTNSIDLKITLINGATIQFFSIESIETVRGFTLTHLIIDECAFAREVTTSGQNIFNEILLPMLDKKGKKCIFVSTPFGKQGLFYRQYTNSLSDSNNYDLVYVPVTQVKDKDWVENKRKEMPELSFKQEYLCEFLDDGSSYFSNFSGLFKEDIKLSRGKKWGGVDFSTIGEDNTVFTIIDENNNVEQFLITGTLDEKYDKIAALINKYDNDLISIYMENNSMGVVMINEIKKKIKKKNLIREFNTNSKTKPDIINNLAHEIELGNLNFSKSNIILYNELSTFTYTINQNTKNVSFGAKIGYHDDHVMSLALALYSRTNYKNKPGIFRL